MENFQDVTLFFHITLLPLQIAKLNEIQMDLLTVRRCNQLDQLAKIRRWVHGIFSFLLLTAGHRLLFLINLPMVAWEIYEAHAKREHMMSAKEFFENEIPRYYFYLCYFITTFCIYLDLAVSSN